MPGRRRRLGSHGACHGAGTSGCALNERNGTIRFALLHDIRRAMACRLRRHSSAIPQETHGCCRHSRIISHPIFPVPMTPSCLPTSEIPRSPLHRPAFNSAVIHDMRRDTASISPNACSATTVELRPGILQTTILCSLAVGKSIESKPIPQTAIIFNRGSCCRIGRGNFTPPLEFSRISASDTRRTFSSSSVGRSAYRMTSANSYRPVDAETD